MLVIAVKQEVEGREIKYTSAYRCSCGWGQRYKALPPYDSLPEAEPAHNFKQLHANELRIFYGTDKAGEYEALASQVMAEYKAAGTDTSKLKVLEKKLLADIVAAMKRMHMKGDSNPRYSHAKKTNAGAVEALGEHAELFKGDSK